MRAAVAVRTIAYLIAILVVGPKTAQLIRYDLNGDEWMIKGLLKGIAYTAGFVVLGTIGVKIIAYIEHANYPLEWTKGRKTTENDPWLQGKAPDLTLTRRVTPQGRQPNLRNWEHEKYTKQTNIDATRASRATPKKPSSRYNLIRGGTNRATKGQEAKATPPKKNQTKKKRLRA